MEKLCIYTHPSALEHDTGFSHPENIARITALNETIKSSLLSHIPLVTAPAATEDQILLAHSYGYLSHVRSLIPEKGHSQIDNDTIVSPGSYDAALRAAGAVCQAVDDVMESKVKAGFSLMRPPGHHAEPELSMGFCLFNSIFIGARHAQEKHGAAKVAIVDFDVHHGNGTDSMARRHDGSILFVSTHQYPLWPMSGLEEDNDETVLNFTMPPGSGPDIFRKLYNDKVLPALDAFAPDLLMISAGFDAHRLDPLAQLNLETEDFSWVTSALKYIADRHCEGRIVSVLEGGYNLEALTSSVAAHLAALCE